MEHTKALYEEKCNGASAILVRLYRQYEVMHVQQKNRDLDTVREEKVLYGINKTKDNLLNYLTDDSGKLGLPPLSIDDAMRLIGVTEQKAKRIALNDVQDATNGRPDPQSAAKNLERFNESLYHDPWDYMTVAAVSKK